MATWFDIHGCAFWSHKDSELAVILFIQWVDRENFAEFLNRGFAISLVLTWIQVSTQYRALVSVARRNLILRASLLTVENRRNSFGFLKKGFLGFLMST